MFYEIIKYLASFITPTNCKENSKKTSELQYSPTDVEDNTRNIFRNYLTKLLMEFSVKACDKLIVDSNFAKDEITNLLKIKKNKIFPIYLGIDKKYLENSENNFYIKSFDYNNYILSVLSCVKYHNILYKNYHKLHRLFYLQIFFSNLFVSYHLNSQNFQNYNTHKEAPFFLK